MEYISSDTNIWLDFVAIDHLELPFKLPHIYLMNGDAIRDELLFPPGLNECLIAYGLVETELTEKEFFLVEEYTERYVKLSVYDCVALAIAKCRAIVLMTGDRLLRKAALDEGVAVMGTIGVLDQLYSGKYIESEVYTECMQRLQKLNGGKVRLPAKEIEKRLEVTQNKEKELSI